MNILHTLRKHIARTSSLVIALLLSVTFLIPIQASALTFHANHIIDDRVFDRSSSMSASSIDSWLNSHYGSTSCISTLHGFTAPDPTGYSPTGGYTYGGYVSAGRVIYDAAQAYDINPQVLLTTLQKEQSLVTGTSGCSTLRYTGAMGYGCPDGGTTYNYSGLQLYAIHGTRVTSVTGTCVNSSSKAGFSQQVIRGAWLLKFGEQRSEGNTNWAIIRGSWNNSDDLETCYSGPMTQGYHKTCPSGSATYYDGYTTIDGSAVHMDTGSTATLYWYTPHIHGNQLFYNTFTSWFGSTLSGPNLPSCQTDMSKSVCVWRLENPHNHNEFLTSSANERDNLVYFNHFAYKGIAFFASPILSSSSIAVERLYNAHSGLHFWTASAHEKNVLVSRGYRDEGIAFYAASSVSSSIAADPVYRLYNTRSGQHIWTISSSEKNDLISKGYVYEGLAFYSAKIQVGEATPPTGYMNVYRFRGLPGDDHFWTSSVSERNRLIYGGYDYEAVAFFVPTSSSGLPVYRLYSSKLHQHFWTASNNEKNNLIHSGYWRYEGVAWFVPSAQTGTPVYRLYSSGQHNRHFWTTSLSEKNNLASGTWRYEGIAWHN